MKKKVLIYSSNFPFGRGEEFMANEINELAKQNIELTLVPNFIRGEKKQNLNPAVHIDYSLSHLFKNKVKLALQVVFLSNFVLALIAFYLKKPATLFKPFFIKYFFGLSAFQLWVKQTSPKADIHLSVWFNYRVHALINSRKTGFLEGKIISRAHGYDIYEERFNKGEFWPNRQEIVDEIDWVLPISENGAKYLGKKYGQQHKIKAIYLGVLPFGARIQSATGVHFVSCSSAIPLKRLDLIQNYILEYATKYTDQQVKWSHIGADTFYTESKSNLPSNFTFNNVGYVENSALRKKMLDLNANIFINLSDTEGIPVTIMEAQSIGVPAIARNIGGISEIVTTSNGSLLPPFPTFEDFEKGVSSILNNYTSKSEASLATFTTQFNSVNNATALFQIF
ncbi:MAG: glycosyltransferase [Flavobacteriales bacterium]|nr:glycosyltransferase [Flavobacteriales bacterium]